MWPFKRKKSSHPRNPGRPCSHCGGTSTRVIICHGSDHPDYVRVWNGQRFWTYRCSACGKDFYVEESQAGNTEEVYSEDSLIDDEEALQSAEEALKRQIDSDNDRKCR
jgi:hypothetical protein